MCNEKCLWCTLSLQVGHSVSVLMTFFSPAVLILLLLFNSQNQLAKDCPVDIFALYGFIQHGPGAPCSHLSVVERKGIHR